MENEVSPWLIFGYSGIVILALSIFAITVTRKLQRVPGSHAQTLVELAVQSLNNYVAGIIGPGGEKYTPFVGTLFIYILVMNLLGNIPFFKSPTSNLSITAALAIVVFVYYHYAGIREAGFKNWIMHFVGEPLWLAPLMFPIHVIGEFARPVSLSLRLFGNIFGEETVVAVLAGMSIVVIKHFIVIPFQWPMMLFGIFTAFVQALVFATLTAIYIAIAVERHAEH